MKNHIKIIAMVACIALIFGIVSGCNNNKKSSSQLNTTTKATSGSSTTDSTTTGTSTSSSDTTTATSLTDTTKVVTTEGASNFIENFKGKTYYSHLKTASTLYWINADRLTDPERNMMLSLQGIVAQEKSEIFLYYSYNKLWFDALKEFYGITFIEVKNPWDMVDKFKGKLKNNGFVKYTKYDATKVYLDNPTDPCSINTATVIAGQEKYLVVENDLISLAKKHGLTQKADGSDYYEIEVYYKYSADLNKDVFTSISYVEANLRDMAVALKTMVWRDKNMDDMSYMLSQMNPNGIILGWHDSEGVGVMTGTLSSYSTIATDHSNNFSVYAGLPKKIFKQKPPAKYEVKGKKDVHYVTFIMSDGDNIMWIDRNFAYDKKYFGATNRGAIPFGWQLSPSLTEFSPLFTRYLYKNATVNDNFVASFSGLGYMNPSSYPAALLDEYAKRTSQYMNAMNMNYVTMLDVFDFPETLGTTNDKRILNSYSKYNNIKGGFVFYTVDQYVHRTKAGGIYWSNGKPFVNLRESLAPSDWANEGHDASRSLEVASKLAYRINSYKKDCTVIEGYTAINVHPWTMTYDDAVSAVNLFDKNVVVVSPTEFMELIAKNVKKVDVPILNDVKTFDYSKMIFNNANSYLDLENVKTKAATTRLSFDFETGGTQGWTILAGKQELDQAYYSQIAGNKWGIMFAGSNFGKKSTVPNAAAYNKITLPNKSVLKLKIKSNATTSKTRIQIINSDITVDTIYNWTDWKKGGDSWYEIDLSKYAGKTVTISVQFGDSATNNGSACSIDDIVIE